MDASELKAYEQQLAQVQGALATDKGNEELANLEAELKNLISLTKQLLEAGQAPTSSSSSSSSSAPAPSTGARKTARQEEPTRGLPDTIRYSAGDECQAKYAGDGRWYAARIVSVGGSSSDPKYTVLYKGYDSTEIVTADLLRPLKSNAKSNHYAAAVGESQSSTDKRLSSSLNKSTPEDEQEKERKRKRFDKKAERTANKTAEANAIQNSWQKFARKAEKKGTLKADKSMFKTPDDPLAKVGVVGAGRGMTQYGDRKKHIYDEAD